VENLEEEHSTRNARLMRIMEDMHVAENRGSGISAMLRAMRDANLEPPQFADRRTSFLVTFHNHTLLNPEAITWLNQFAYRQLNDRQRLTLVYLRQHDQITNSDYRRLNRVDAVIAGQELRSLLQTGLIEQHGASRWTAYTLQVPHELPRQNTLQVDEEKILVYVREHGSINNTECRRLLEVDDKRAWYLLNKLCNLGMLKHVGKGRWSHYTLP
jgi:predicted HTH transcriptional regulator